MQPEFKVEMMKKLLFPVFVLMAVVLMDGCTSGKQAYQKGNYDDAVLKAIKRLRKNPNSKKAAETLRSSYPMTIQWHKDNIEQAKLSNYEFKWERVISEYKSVNYLYNELNRCPACIRLISNPVHYVSELNDAKNQAADIRYAKGEEMLNRARSNRDKLEAREAYKHYAVACNLLKDYKDSRDKMAEAKFLATLKVVVEPMPIHSRNLQLSNEFFENKIMEFMETMPVNEFVQFYSYTEAKNIGLKEPDQIIRLQFDDFVLGQVYLKEKEIQQSKDSVVLAIIKASNEVSMSNALAYSGIDPLSTLKYEPTVQFTTPMVNYGHKAFAGGNKDKVTVCHKIPASLGVSKTISISKNALQHHLDHGDVQGTCNGEAEPTDAADNQEETGSTGGTSTDSNGGNNTGTDTSSGDTSGTGSDNGGNTSGTAGSSTTTGTSTTTGNNGSVFDNHPNSGNTEQTTSGQTSTGQGGQQEAKPTTQKVYGSVKATMHIFSKTLTSRGVLDFQIIDAYSQRVLTQEKMPGEFVWYTEWGYFNGDERALDSYFMEITKLKEATPPPPQDLFVAFTQPIYRQVTHKIRNFYRTY
ncbi:MAG: hypothetical protein ACR2MX_07175 [Cyclobacteriaceae bacterium]